LQHGYRCGCVGARSVSRAACAFTPARLGDEPSDLPSICAGCVSFPWFATEFPRWFATVQIRGPCCRADCRCVGYRCGCVGARSISRATCAFTPARLGDEPSDLPLLRAGCVSFPWLPAEFPRWFAAVQIRGPCCWADCRCGCVGYRCSALALAPSVVPPAPSLQLVSG
jgi:hypothetical protein